MWILAENRGELVSTAAMTQIMGSSRNHLQKVLQRLAHAGLVEATRGPSGGFKLAVDPSAISLMDIYVSIEGPIRLQGCMLGNPTCTRTKCVTGNLANEVNDIFQNYFYGTSLADLVEGQPTRRRNQSQ